MSALYQFRHLAVEEGQQQGTDVGSVDVGIRHDDDAMVTELVRVELFTPDATAKRGDQGAHLCRRQHLVEASLFDVEDLALQRQDGLGAAIPALLGGAAGRITLHQVELGQRRVLFLAVGELSRKTGNVQHALAAGHLARLARRLAGPRSFYHLARDRLRVLRVLCQEVRQLLRHQRLYHTLDL